MTATTGGRAAPDLSGNVLKTRNWQVLTESQTHEVGIGSALADDLQQTSDVRRRTQCLVVVRLRSITCTPCKRYSRTRGPLTPVLPAG